MKKRLQKIEALALTVIMCSNFMQTGAYAADFSDSSAVPVYQADVFEDAGDTLPSEEPVISDDAAPSPFISGDAAETDGLSEQDKEAQDAGNENYTNENNSNNYNHDELVISVPYAEAAEINVSEDYLEALAASAGENGKVDVVFVIDSTGSMYDEIAGVRNNLNKFTETLQTAGLNFQIAVVEYKDITVGGEEDSTKVLQLDGRKWFTTASDVSELLSSIDVYGGGDNPETVLDAIGLVNTLDFRSDASKFAILLTDDEYKNSNNYGYFEMSDAITALKNKGVSMSVITSYWLQSTYDSLCTGTDGIFADIYGNFAEELVKLASYVQTVVNPVTFKLSSEISSPGEADTVLCTLTAEVSASDEKNTANNIEIKLELPENLTGATIEEAELTKTIGSLEPGATKTLTWSFSFPAPYEDTNYKWKVTAECEDFATGVVCQAQDSFSVTGTKASDYAFKFGIDNYNFLNSYSAFGNGSIYINLSDLTAYLDDLNNTELNQTANWYAADGTINSLRKGNLSAWGGSCYGMSLTAALFKAGILNTSSFGGLTTYSLPELQAASNSALESFINIYHISQASDVAMDYELESIGSAGFSSVMSTMVAMADNIGKPEKKQTPYLVRLRGSVGGHAVVCYGVEYGDYTLGSVKYDKRLLIADPNSAKEEYIYITSDNQNAYFSNGSSYNQFGYRKATLSELNSHDYEDSIKNHTAKWYAKEMTDYVIEQSKGKKAVIIAGKVVLDEGLDIEAYSPDDEPLDGSGHAKAPMMIINSSDAITSDYTITPQNDDELDATFYFEDYALSVDADADNAEFKQDGSIELENATGDVTLGLTLNDSSFDFVTINGEADGTVTIKQEGDSLFVNGDISDFTIQNMDSEGNTSEFFVDGNKDVKVEMKPGEDELSVKHDPNGTGIYDTPVDSHIHNYDVTFNWESNEVCKAVIKCKDASCELNAEVPCEVSYQRDSESTCSSGGTERYTATCKYEGKVYTEARFYSIGTPSHTVVVEPAVEATCTETGLTEGQKCSVCGQILKEQTVVPAKGHEWEEEARIDKKPTCGTDGSKSIHCKNCDEVKDATVIPATGKHEYGEYEIVKEATAVAKGEKKHTCTICGNIEKEVIDKLPATGTLSMKTIPLKVKQTTNAFKVTGLAKGDKVKSFKSSNTKIAVIDKNGKITAKAAGNAKITVTLASGKKLTATVKVQKSTVKTTKLTVKNKTISLKKGKTYQINPVVTPLTSQQKLTYESSDSKVAYVSSKGKITAKKKGTAVITVKSGSKSVKIKVTVK